MNVACNSPDTVSHRVSISLELQRLRTLLKIHSIELHAKLLRGCALARTRARWHARGTNTSHVDPILGAWARHFVRGSDGMRGRRSGAYLGVGVRVMGLTRIVGDSRASDAPGQAPLRPSRRAPCPRHPVVGVCRRGGLRRGRRAAPRRDLTDSKRGNCATRGPVRDLPAGDVAIKRGELHH